MAKTMVWRPGADFPHPDGADATRREIASVPESSITPQFVSLHACPGVSGFRGMGLDLGGRF